MCLVFVDVCVYVHQCLRIDESVCVHARVFEAAELLGKDEHFKNSCSNVQRHHFLPKSKTVIFLDSLQRHANEKGGANVLY